MDNKKNDWILETVQNPDFTFQDFKDNDIDASNTSMYDRERYLNSPIIQGMPEFQTNGQFDKTKFNAFYDFARESYQTLAEQTYNASEATPKAIFSYNNIWVSPERRSKEVDFRIDKINNPNRQKIGIEGFGYISSPTRTPQEIAQDEKIFNPETNSWEESPNDSWLLRNWFEPVAMATYDYDVDANGNPTNIESEIVHRKGEYKINPETGTYYYEKLNGRSPYGKDLLSPFDVITRDGSVANQYDFFDSDGISKSFIGSVAKTTARLAPMLIPGVGGYYVAANIALELGQVLPILYKTTFGLGSSDNSFLNTVEGVAASFSANRVSQEGQQSFFTSENVLNLIGDVAKQLYEQRWLFSKAPRAFKKYGISKGPNDTPSALDKEIERRAAAYKQQYMENDKLFANLDMSTIDETRMMQLFEADAIISKEAAAKAAIWGEKYQEAYQNLGKYISRMYMTTTASYQAYQDAKEEGASDMEAAMVFWGYLAGEYAIISSELGERVLPELRADKIEIRNMLEKVSAQAGGTIETTKKIAGASADRVAKATGLKKIFMQSGNLAQKTFSKANNLLSKAIKPITAGGGSLLANALGEGVEELSEEVLYDLTRGTFNVLQFLAGDDFRLSTFDNWAARYGQSFFGGALGGALFEGINNIENRRLYNPDAEQANQQLIYHVRNGRANEVKETLKKMRDQHAFGNPNLSSTPVSIKDNGDDGKTLVYGEGTPEDNQNEAVYRAMVAYVDNIEKVLSQENMVIPDHMLANSDGVNEKEILQQIRYQYLLDSPDLGGMLQDFNDLSDRFLKLHSQLSELESVTDPVKRTPTWDDEVKEVKRQLNELRKERENFFTAENQSKYIGNMMFASNEAINRSFVNITFKNFAENNFNKLLSELSEYELTLAKQRYQDYLQYEAKKSLKVGYDTFIDLNKQLSSFVQKLGKENYPKYVETRSKLLDIQIPIIGDENPLRKLIQTEEGQEPANSVSLFELISLYGTDDMSEDEVMKTANSLKLLYNPFDEIQNILSQQDPFSESLSSLESKIDFLKNILTTLNQISDIKLDSATANSLGQILKYVSIIPKDATSGLDGEAVKVFEGIPQIEEIYSKFRMGLDYSTINSKYNTLVQELDALVQSDPTLSTSAEELKNTILNSFRGIIENPEFIDTYNQINSILQDSVLNPIAGLLSQLKVTRDGNKSVFDIIDKAGTIFKTKDVRDFVIDGELTTQDIDDARQIIQQLQSVIRAAQSDNINAINPFGFNVTMNKILKNNDLAEIDGETAALMLQDLEIYDRKLSFIRQLHDMNRESTLKEQQRVGVNLTYLSYDMIGDLENSSLYNVVEEGIVKPRVLRLVDPTGGVAMEKLINSEIEMACNNATTIAEQIRVNSRNVDITDEDTLSQMAKELNAIEEALHSRFKELFTKYGRSQVMAQLLPGFVKFTNLNTDSKHIDKSGMSKSGIYSDTTEFNDQEKLSYLASLIATKPLDFEYLYTNVIKEDTTGIAPTPVQKFTIRVLYGNLIDPSIYNDIVTSTGVNYNGLQIVKNLVLATGVPGSGKTSACARLAVAMLKKSNPNLKAWTCGPSPIHAKNLKASVDIEDAEEYDSEALLDILGTNETDINKTDSIIISKTAIGDMPQYFKDIMLQRKGFTETTKIPSIATNQETASIANIPSIIMIDEYTHFSAAELLFISKFAQKYNIPIMGFGDPGQSGKSLEFKIPGERPLANDASIIYCISSPKLTISMRASNTNKRDNQQVTKLLSEQYPTYGSMGDGVTGESLWNKLKSLSKQGDEYKFKYTRTSSGALYGDYLMNEADFNLETIRSLIPTLRPGEKIGILYENTDSKLYKLISQLNPSEQSHLEIKNASILFDEKAAQGNECQYFIIDIDWGAKKKIDVVNDTNTFYSYSDFTKALHTITSRSKWGSIILDSSVEGKGLSAVVDPNIFQEVPENAVSVIDDFKNDNVLKAFKDRQINIQDALIEGYTYTPVAAPTLGGGGGNGTGIVEVLQSDFEPTKIDFSNNIIITLPAGKDPLKPLSKNKAFVFSKNADEVATIVNNATELQEKIDSYVASDKSLVIAQIPKSTYNTSTLQEFIENEGDDKTLSSKYIKFIIKYSKGKKRAKNYTYKYNVGAKYKYKSQHFEILARKDGNYYLKHLINGHVSIINSETFEKDATEITEEVPGEERIGSAIASNISEGKKYSDEEIANTIKYAENDELGMLVYTNFGYRSGVSLETNDQGEPIVEEINGVRNYVINGYGHTDMHMSDIQALLKLNGVVDPDSPSKTLSYVPVDQFEKAKYVLAEIRSIIKDNKGDDIVAKINNLLALNNINISIQGEAQFNIRIQRKWNPSVDAIFNSANPEIHNSRQIVCTLTDTSNNKFDITIGTIQSSQTANTFREKITKGMSAEQKEVVNNAFEKRIDFLKHLEKHAFSGLKDGESTEVRYIPLNGSLNSDTKLTNVTLRYISKEGNLEEKGSEGAKLFTYSQLKEKKDIIISNPFILTGKFKDKSTLEKLRNGSVICFITEELDFEYKGYKAANNPDILGTAYMDACLSGDQELLQRVKCLLLTPQGISFKDYMKSVIDNKQSLLGGSKNDIVMPEGNVNTSSKLLRQFLLMDAELTEFIRGDFAPTKNYSLSNNPSEKPVIVLDSKEQAIKLKKVFDTFLARTVAIIENWDDYIKTGKPKNKKGTNKLYTKTATLDTILPHDAELEGAFKKLKDDFESDNAVAILRNKFDELVAGSLKEGETLGIDSWVDGGVASEFAKHRSFNISTAFNSFFSVFVDDEYKFVAEETDNGVLLNWLSENLPKFKDLDENSINSNFGHGIYFNPIYQRSEKGQYDQERKAAEMFYPADTGFNREYFVNVDPQTSTHMISKDVLEGIYGELNYTPPADKLEAKYEIGQVFTASIKFGDNKTTTRNKHLVITGFSAGKYLLRPLTVSKKDNKDIVEMGVTTYRIPFAELENSINTPRSKIETENAKITALKEASSLTEKYKDQVQEHKWSYKEDKENKEKDKQNNKKPFNDTNTEEKVKDFFEYFNGHASDAVKEKLDLYEANNILSESGIRAFMKLYYQGNSKNAAHNKYPGHYDILDNIKSNLKGYIASVKNSADLTPGDLPILYVTGAYIGEDGNPHYLRTIGTLNEFIKHRAYQREEFKGIKINSIYNISVSGDHLIASINLGGNVYQIDINLNKEDELPNITLTSARAATPEPQQIEMSLQKILYNFRNKLCEKLGVDTSLKEFSEEQRNTIKQTFINSDFGKLLIYRGNDPNNPMFQAQYQKNIKLYTELIFNILTDSKEKESVIDIRIKMLMAAVDGSETTSEIDKIKDEFRTWCNNTESCALGIF